MFIQIYTFCFENLYIYFVLFLLLLIFFENYLIQEKIIKFDFLLSLFCYTILFIQCYFYNDQFVFLCLIGLFVSLLLLYFLKKVLTVKMDTLIANISCFIQVIVVLTCILFLLHYFPYLYTIEFISVILFICFVLLLSSNYCVFRNQMINSNENYCNKILFIDFIKREYGKIILLFLLIVIFIAMYYFADKQHFIISAIPFIFVFMVLYQLILIDLFSRASKKKDFFSSENIRDLLVNSCCSYYCYPITVYILIYMIIMLFQLIFTNYDDSNKNLYEDIYENLINYDD